MSFRLIYELEPPRVPDLKKVRTQIEIFGPIVDSILVPDNHLGLPAMSSLALALEVRAHGFKPIVALNARDRNHLRLASDLITLRAYEVEEVLFLYGDPIESGRSDLSVKHMLADESGSGLKRGVAASIGKPLRWKSRADFLFTQLAFDRAKPGRWREAEGFAHPVYCGVIALPNREIAERVSNHIPDLNIPTSYMDAFDEDSDAGFSAAMGELDVLKTSGVDGAHLVVPARWRRFAELLENWVVEQGSP